MCAVVGYVGKSLCRSFIFEGLARLEYRGYDSAGFACLDPVSQRLLYSKSSGHLTHLTEQIKNNPIDGFLGVGHTRWSTHGATAEHNAHPHFDCSKTISVVHNGIIENYAEIKRDLIDSGHLFYSETDTEVISHLFESLTQQASIHPADIAAIVTKLDGAYAFIVMLQAFPDSLLVVRKKSPLCIGIGEDEMFIASDALAFAGTTTKAIFLPDASFAIVTQDEVKIYDFQGQPLFFGIEQISSSFVYADKGEYEHFMLKEIYEQRNAVRATIESLDAKQSILLDQLGITEEQLTSITEISFIACGTSWHAAQLARFFFEAIVHIPVRVHVASEFRYHSFFPNTNALYIFISQSGETADTLEALRLVNAYELRTIALTNVAMSTIVREARGFVLTCAGPEIAVASTKAFSTQLAALYWLAHYCALKAGRMQQCAMAQAENDIIRIADTLESVINQYRNSIDDAYAKCYAIYDKALFLGRHISYPLAMEAALKLKEVAYVFAESYPAGELKHGPLALVDKNMPVYIFSHHDPIIYQKLLSNAHEVQSRGGRIIVFAYAGQEELCALAETAFIVPAKASLLGPLAMIGLVQYFVYAIARERGCSIDKPRNLAKSVTVE